MEVIPAIDLKGGRCVRLYQGDFRKETVFSPDPVAMARHWEGEGAPRLHIVDLDGASLGKPVHSQAIRQIAAAVKIPVQVGGGLRDMKAIQDTLSLGVERVVLGTAAVENLPLVAEACRRYGEGILVAVDAREGKVATRAWREKTSLEVTAVIGELARLGVRRFLYTDISRDGTLAGPDLEGVRQLLALFKLPLLASGGVASLEHLQALARLGVEGAIVGRALYTGDISLREAVALLGRKA